MPRVSETSAPTTSGTKSLARCCCCGTGCGVVMSPAGMPSALDSTDMGSPAGTRGWVSEAGTGLAVDRRRGERAAVDLHRQVLRQRGCEDLLGAVVEHADRVAADLDPAGDHPGVAHLRGRAVQPRWWVHGLDREQER